MTERRCETCRWWTEDEWSERARFRFESDYGAEGQLKYHRACRAQMLPTGSWRRQADVVPLAVLGNIYGEEGDELLTAPDFFCALHEEKP